jgi:SAM-dependent methyltransferase
MQAGDGSPWADQAFLRTVQYVTDRNLAARQSIYAYQRPALDLPAAVIGLIPLTGSETVADVGCGNGYYLAELARRGHRGPVLGIDMSPGMLAAAGRRAPAARLVAGDAAELPLRGQAADLTCAMHMLYLVPDPARAVAELRRVTRPAGLAVVGLNADDHLSELRQLINAVLGEPGRPAALPIWDLVSLDQGTDLLTRFFTSVTRHDFTGELVLPGPEPVEAYVRSLGITRDAAELDRIVAAVSSRLPFGADGQFRVRTHAGCLICA